MFEVCSVGLAGVWRDFGSIVGVVLGLCGHYFGLCVTISVCWGFYSNLGSYHLTSLNPDPPETQCPRPNGGGAKPGFWTSF